MKHNFGMQELGALAARDYLNILQKEHELEWTFVGPALEMHQGTTRERRGVYRIGSDNPVFDANHKSTISVDDLAVATLDEAENPKHIKQRFTVAYECFRSLSRREAA